MLPFFCFFFFWLRMFLFVSLLRMMLAIYIFYIEILYLTIELFLSGLQVKNFKIMNECHFIKRFFGTYKMIIFLIFFVNILNYIIRFSDVESFFHSWDTFYLVMRYYSFNMLLYLVGKYPV